MQHHDDVAHVLFDENSNPVREQLLVDHLTGTAALAAAFAAAFGAESWGRAAGLLHDVGKSSQAGQRRMRDPQHAPKCDHSTRGAQLAYQQRNLPISFAVAGHHGHLPAGGAMSESDPGRGTLTSRMRKTFPDCEPFLSRWAVELPALTELSALLRSYDGRGGMPFALAFFTRMLHACLVDADYLDTERFLRPQQMARGAFQPIDVLEKRLKDYMAKHFADCGGTLNEARKRIRLGCLASAELPPGVFTLTVPTGGGKTLSSLSFALRHAARHGLRRVVYAIPYTSILEQTADTFARALGADQVVAHYADAFVDDAPDDWADDVLHRKHLASENWDAPVVVTTNVQLFESLYASRPGRCRKLHRLAWSVIVLDEAQLLPVRFLLPCLRALGELARNYGATVVLMSATQPELQQFLPGTLPAREMIADIPPLYAALKRAVIRLESDVTTLSQVAERLTDEPQALCVVNTRKRARELYEQLPAEGRYHLSTLMLPRDRRRVLAEVRTALLEGRPCRLASTSMVEAGVDVDFPTGWREMSGLDSLLQAAGRVNREGKRAAEESVLHVFRLEGERLFADLPQRAEVARLVFGAHADVTAPDAIRMYFNNLYHVKGEEALDDQRILEALEVRDGLYPFQSVSEKFRLIDDDTVTVVIPSEDDEGNALRRRLDAGDPDRALLRQAGASALQLRRQAAQKLYAIGVLRMVTEEVYLLLDPDRYSPDTGLDLSLDAGLGYSV